MGWEKRRFKGNVSNNLFYDDIDDILAFGGAMWYDQDRAMREITTMSCVKVIAESTAQLPVALWQNRGRDKKEVKLHPSAYAIRREPNEYQSAFAFRETLQANSLLSGSLYSFKSYNRRGEITSLLPVNSEFVVPFSYKNELRFLGYQDGKNFSTERLLPGGKIGFQYKEPGGGYSYFLRDEMLFIPALSMNGLVGFTPIQYINESMCLASTARKYGSKLFKNGANIRGVLQYPGKLTDKEMADRIKKSWEESFSGLENAHKTPVLEHGMEYKGISMSAKDAQLLELRKFQRAEIAGFFRVPLHLIDDLTRSTFSNIEQQDIDFVKHCLMPWVRRWEQGLDRDLLTDDERRNKDMYFRFNVDAMLAGDSETRSKVWHAAVLDGWMTPNEVREKENLPPHPDGDKLLTPMNTMPSDEAQEPEKDPKIKNDEEEEEDGDAEE